MTNTIPLSGPVNKWCKDAAFIADYNALAAAPIRARAGALGTKLVIKFGRKDGNV
ncbi:MAG: hypothetical protein HC777_02725 [Hyphomonadaceae bacterium]|nr:hypothetical protein [Hyphomonadaceae bacterium]